MKLKLVILLFILTYSKLLPVNLEVTFGGSLGATMDFSQIVASLEIAKPLEGRRTDCGFSVNAFLDIGANFELQNTGALNSVSFLFETGYNYYMRIRSKYEDILEEHKERFKYYNLILGILPKLNFNYGISFGIGVGIFLPLYSWASQERTETTLGLGSYSGVSKFDFKKISYMYKIPVMPYIKLNLERNFYMSELWVFKIGANILYNFGMEFNMENLRKDTKMYAFDKYKFSSLDFEFFLGFGFGRPK